VLPKDLSDILENYDPEDFDIVITKINFEDSNPKFDIQLSVIGYNDEDDIIRTWTIQTKQYRKSKIFLDYSSTMGISQDHPILWQFSDIQSELYFSGHCADVDKLFVNLYKIHKSFFKDFLPFEETINIDAGFNKLLNTSSGLLAKGPLKLMKQYAGILAQHKLTHSLIEDTIPTFWDGENHVNETGNAKVLFIDNSYIIADEFQFL
jgi:hypothetical protein